MTHMCVDTTSRQAAHLGLSVEILNDATGTLPLENSGGTAAGEELHRATLVAQGQFFADVVSTDEWLDQDRRLTASPRTPAPGARRSVGEVGSQSVLEDLAEVCHDQIRALSAERLRVALLVDGHDELEAAGATGNDAVLRRLVNRRSPGLDAEPAARGEQHVGRRLCRSPSASMPVPSTHSSIKPVRWAPSSRAPVFVLPDTTAQCNLASCTSSR